MERNDARGKHCENDKLYVRTPLIESKPLSKIAGCDVYLKMENVQPPGSFKIRGMANIVKKGKEQGYTRAVASSGGNAGLAVAYACRKLNVPLKIFIPGSTPQFVKECLEDQEAEVIYAGDVWDHADAKAREEGTKPDTKYIHPFDSQEAWDGHTSLVHELKEDLADNTPDLVVTSVGGGGLLCGIAQGMAEVGWGSVPILAMETIGADCFNKAVQAGKLVTLLDITSIAKCLGALTVCSRAFDYYKERPIISEVIPDKECLETCFRFLDDHRVLVEPACGAAIAALYSGTIKRLQQEGKLTQLKRIVVIVCGGATVNMDMMYKWKKEVGL